MRWIVRHVRGNVVAYLALFIAVSTAGAWAAGTIGPTDIKPNAVRAKHIKQNQVRASEIAPNAVRPAHVRLVEHRKVAGEVQGDSIRGAPQITLKPPPGALIAVFARVEGRKVTNSVPMEPCTVSLLEDVAPFGDVSGGREMLAFSSTSYSTRVTAAHSAAGIHEFADPGGSWIVLRPQEPGTRTRYGFYYENSIGDTCAFKNRELWLQVIR